MTMKNLIIITIIIVSTVLLLLAHCRIGHKSTSSEIVNAIVTNVYKGGYDKCCVVIEYDGITRVLNDVDLYVRYDKRLGETVKVYMITRTYKFGKDTRMLVYNKGLLDK